MEKALELEKKLFAEGMFLIAGVDEVGRGCLAGPVVAASFFLGKEQIVNSKLKERVNDSKTLSVKQRDLLFEELTNDFEFGIGLVEVSEIDKTNILLASLQAMRNSLLTLNKKTDFVLIDGNQKIKNISTRQIPIIGGDKKVFSIAAASIIAKVYRDRLMLKIDELYPLYGFARHKGYGTEFHRQAIKEYGPCPEHRLSFEPLKSFLKEKAK
jgi:ribonuclease HII